MDAASTRFDFDSAWLLAMNGAFPRRSIWNSGVTLDNPTPSAPEIAAAHPLAWLSYEAFSGVFFYHTGGARRVVCAEDVTAADMAALDWTLQAPADSFDDSLHPSAPTFYIPPAAGGAGAGGGAGGAGGGAGAGGAGGAGAGGGAGGAGGVGGAGAGGGAGGVGGGSLGGVGGASPVGKRAKGARTAPEIVLTVTRTSGDACIPEISAGVPDPAPITDVFTVSAAFAADPFARAGELWFITINAGTPTGPRNLHLGTHAAGSTVAAANLTLLARPGQVFGVQALAHLPHVGLDSSGGAWASMRAGCVPEGGDVYSPDGDDTYSPDGINEYGPP